MDENHWTKLYTILEFHQYFHYYPLSIPKPNDGHHIAFSHHASLGSSGLWKFLVLPFVCMCFYLFFIFLKIFILFFREGKGDRKRGRETSVCGCLSCTPYRWPGRQPRHVPHQEWNQRPLDSQAAGRHSTAEPHQPGLCVCFQWPWQFSRVLVRYFVGCTSTCVCLMGSCDQTQGEGGYGVWREHSRYELPFWLHCVRGYVVSTWLITGDVDLDHLVMGGGSVTFLCCQFSLFPFPP